MAQSVKLLARFDAKEETAAREEFTMSRAAMVALIVTLVVVAFLLGRLAYGGGMFAGGS